MDLDGSVVNGDCYWLALNPGQSTDLLWLTLAVANSSFIEAFTTAVSTTSCMREDGGYDSVRGALSIAGPVTLRVA